MKTNIYIFFMLISMGLFSSCGESTIPTDNTNEQEQVQAEDKSGGEENTEESKKELGENEEPQSIRLGEELTLAERFAEVTQRGEASVVWVADDEYQSVFEFSNEKRFKGSFKKGPNKFEGDWKIEGELFSMKMDGDDAWNPIPLTVVDRKTMVMMNLEFKAE